MDAVIVGWHEVDVVEGVEEKGANSASGLSSKRHDSRDLEVVMNICEKSESRQNDRIKRRRGGCLGAYRGLK